jgi:GNAT superfamily N-acetyltransferase
MSIEIKKVTDASGKKKFVNCQWNFYEGNPNWVAPIKMDRMKLLNEDKNPFYKHAEIQLFLAYEGKNIVGRIAAITNANHNAIHKDKVGFFGFFESINNQDVANKLFDEAVKWLKTKGMTDIRGPVNPSTNDEVGLLVDAFDMPPVILMTYNPPYYQQLIENYGFKKEKDLLAYILHHDTYASEKLTRMQQIVRDRKGITIRALNFKDAKQFKADVKTLKEIYNAAWQPNWGFVKMTDEEFDFLANDLKTIAEPKLTIIAEIKGKPVGFALSLPDINQSLIYNKNGGILGAVWCLFTKKKKIDLTRIIVLGVLPEFQSSGVDAVLYHEIGETAFDLGMPKGEASWILEDNEMMKRGLETTMKGEVYKTYRIFQKAI